MKAASTASALATAFFLLAAVHGQTPGETTIRTQTQLVEIDVSVQDSQGRPVHDLTQNDFTILDKGKPRPIQDFSFGADALGARAPAVVLPPNVFTNTVASGDHIEHPVAVLFDGVNTAWENQSWARLRTLALLKSLPADQTVALYALAPDLSILQPYTNDHRRLLSAMQSFTPARPALESATGRAERNLRRNTNVDDTLGALRVLAGNMAAMPGRKTILWVTSAFRSSALDQFAARDRFNLVIAELNEANVAVCPVDARGLSTVNPAGIDVMEQVATGTGGRAFYNRNDIEVAMSEAITNARAVYTMGFYPPGDELDGTFHPLTVRIARPGLSLHYRQGYYAGGEHTLDKEQKSMLLEAALLSPVDQTNLGIVCVVQKKDATLQLRLTIDPRNLTLKKDNGRVEEMYVESNQQGSVIAKFRDRLDFSVGPEKRAQYRQSGLTYRKSIPWQKDAVKVTVVIRDTATGRLGSLTIPLSSP